MKTMMYYYLVNGQRIEIEVCYSTTTGQYYGRPSETWVVGTQPGHTRRSVLLRPTDCDAYHGITELDLYCRIETAHRILAQYEEDGNTNLEPLLKPLLRDLRQHVHLLYLLADGDPNMNWVETDFLRIPNIYRNTPVHVLVALADDNDSYVRYYVAKNTKTPVDVLVRLSTDRQHWVRCNVASNLRTPVDVLRTLATDDNDEVRYYVSKNPNVPVDVLVALAGDKNSDIRQNVADNCDTPLDVLRMLSTDRMCHVRYYVALNANTPLDVLTTLATDNNSWIRRAVAERGGNDDN